MSAGDAVCTGWLVKSPPERKLQRYAWRRRWFVLRRGRMSGDRDVLEYYRSQRATKPLRAIDLRDCAVCAHTGPGFVRKEFQNQFVFVVKTTARTFYLVAKTEEEMQVWVRSISQVLNLGQLQDGTGFVESLSCTPHSLQPSPASSLPTTHVLSSPLPREELSSGPGAFKESRSESEFPFLPDYLVLSNCETGRLRHASVPTRCDSWSNSLEQTSCDDVFVECLPPLPSSNLGQPLRPGNGALEGPPSRPPAARLWSRESNRPHHDHLSLLETSVSPTMKVDTHPGPRAFGMNELSLLSSTPPPRPPKPSHLSERRSDEQAFWGRRGGLARPSCTLLPRRISVSGSDHVRTWKADVEGQSLRHRDKRLSLNLPCQFSPTSTPASAGAEDSYVPMGPQVAPALAACCSPDDYIPMSLGGLSSPLPALPTDLEPPPVNRDLKPQRKSRPPPLDLRNLSTIREHVSLTRTHTVPCNRTSFLSPERNGFNSARFFASPVSREEEESYIPMEEHRNVSRNSLMLTKKFSLDYLALDFNSASPAPVQQKLLSEEHRVDYVQVDEQKTQALQSTKQEWTDERQSKA
ncbi:GRB2-associated-binding protein 3 [Suncus etruscus]|uniref:GRB2-associated-binding protein 3 n=1 Tax=Suncus etruscus TaxID=109475 RepID=UPI0021103F09|nr:GRB2-associated-binding protein 3 [Suncus etruscus]